jgi:hypothetical protein
VERMAGLLPHAPFPLRVVLFRRCGSRIVQHRASLRAALSSAGATPGYGGIACAINEATLKSRRKTDLADPKPGPSQKVRTLLLPYSYSH